MRSQQENHEEELALLRFLGSNFVDPGALDAQRHWQRVQSGASNTTTSDFTIAKNANGIMTIDETRVEKSERIEAAHVGYYRNDRV